MKEAETDKTSEEDEREENLAETWKCVFRVFERKRDRERKRERQRERESEEESERERESERVRE